MQSIPFLPAVTRAQRLAAEELICGPLYRATPNQFARQGHYRVVRVQSVRGLIDMGLASFDPETRSVTASAKLYALAERAGLLDKTGAARP